MLRLLVFMPIGIALGSGFFLLLSQLTGVNQQRPQTTLQTVNIDIGSMAPPPKLAVRDRKLTPPAAPKLTAMPQLPKPKVQTMPASAMMPSALKVNISAPLVATGVTLNPAIGAFSAADISQPLIEHPQVLSQFPPQYPQRALRHRIEGKVTVEFIVQANGQVKPESIKVVKATPAHIFNQAVKQAIYGWRFQPQQRDGHNIPFRARQTLVFKLER